MEVVTIKDLERTILKDDLEMLVEDVNGNIGNKATLGEIKHYIIDGEATAREEADNKLKENIKELNEKKITKFYASSLGNTNLHDSDSGKPTDMIIYGKSVQDGTPTPESPIEIQSVVNPKVTVCGKNLKDITQSKVAIGYYTDSSGEINDSNSNYIRIVPIKVLPNTKYSISCNLKIYSIWFFNNNTKIKYGYFSSYKGTFTTPIDCSYIRVSIYNESGKTDTSAFRYCQLEFGSSATDYEPYKEKTATLPYTLNAIPVSDGGNVTIDGKQYIADYVDIENKKLVRVIGYGNPFKNYNWNYDSNYNFWYCDSGDYSKTKNLIKIPQDNNSNVHSLWKDGIICNTSDFFNGKVSAEKAFGVGTSGIVCYINTSITSTSYNGCQGTFKNENFYYELPTPTETDLTDAELEAFKALETYYPVTNVSVTSDQLDGHAVFNYLLNMANGWNYVMQQIGETRPIIYDTEVKVLENSIDTAILTAMMEV